jgi:hypothetical protein
MKAMVVQRWEYDISVHTREDIEAVRSGMPPEAGGEEPFLCDDRGVCFFDRTPDGNVNVLRSILNQRGAQGWQLVQIDYRRDRLICTWRRPIGG